MKHRQPPNCRTWEFIKTHPRWHQTQWPVLQQKRHWVCNHEIHRFYNSVPSPGKKRGLLMSWRNYRSLSRKRRVWRKTKSHALPSEAAPCWWCRAQTIRYLCQGHYSCWSCLTWSQVWWEAPIWGSSEVEREGKVTRLHSSLMGWTQLRGPLCNSIWLPCFDQPMCSAPVTCLLSPHLETLNPWAL